ncbi:MAG: DUF2089 family protein [Leptolyngbya sp. PLA1]|nr:DUF2089 family protein [Leptolyngbya sp. PLA1]
MTSLSKADLDLVTQFVLVSGSIKELSAAYGVSYPTMRARLDGLIQRLRAATGAGEADPLSSLLSGLLDRGEMSFGAARAVREFVRTREGGATPTL